MVINPENVIRIGQYQLENLQRNKIGFVFLDLREPELRAREGVGHWLLQGSHPMTAGEAANYVDSLALPPNTPIVLVCENGAKSLGVAMELETKAYINVYIVEGGTSALTFET